MKVLFLAAEMLPYAKVGGLADVAGSLPRALAQLGVQIWRALPRYGRVDPRALGFRRRRRGLRLALPELSVRGRLWVREEGPGLVTWMVDLPGWTDRERVYGEKDDDLRFLLFSAAALEAARMEGVRPDWIHAHDWHAAAAVLLARRDPEFREAGTVLTIHNLGYPGELGPRARKLLGAPEGASFLALGIEAADWITTVSPRYAREILTPEYGEGLEEILKARQDRLVGILNGIDVEFFNPETDPALPVPYNAEALERRRENKVALQREMGLAGDPEAPLAGLVSRLVPQKGVDLLLEALPRLLRDTPLQLALLGSGDEATEAAFRELARRFPGRVGLAFGYNEPLAHRIYAGTDLFLMPSRYEPCGLGQMIALRYGSLPVVRETGGLADTVTDFDPRTGQGNGFVFRPYDPWAFYGAVVRAVENYRHPGLWPRLQRRGMALDFSWTASARRYLELYRRGRAA